MKLISKGLLNKFVEVDDEKVRNSKEPVDQMHLAFKTKNNPYMTNSPKRKNPMNDPNLFIVHFQRIL